MNKIIILDHAQNILDTKHDSLQKSGQIVTLALSNALEVMAVDSWKDMDLPWKAAGKGLDGNKRITLLYDILACLNLPRLFPGNLVINRGFIVPAVVNEGAKYAFLMSAVIIETVCKLHFNVGGNDRHCYDLAVRVGYAAA